MLTRASAGIVVSAALTILTGALALHLGKNGRKREISLHPLMFCLIAAIYLFVFGRRVALLGGLPPNALLHAVGRELRPIPRLAMIVRWAGYTLLMAVATSAFVKYLHSFPPGKGGASAARGTGGRPSRTAEQVIRKFYHYLVTAMFLSPAVRDAPLLRFALAATIGALILVEGLRLFSAHFAISHHLSAAMEPFRNGQDAGVAILSHIWLLSGCALPLFVSAGDTFDAGERLSATAGITAVGVLDSTAALVGTLVGGPQWGGTSKKTLAGSLGGVAASSLVNMAILSRYYQKGTLFVHPTAWRGALGCTSRILLHGALVAAWEAASDQNDNITLPIVAFVASRLILPSEALFPSPS